MKLCVLIPSEEVLTQAGVRIRYGRIAPEMKEAGDLLELRAIDSFASPADFAHDAYIVSKIYDVRSLVVARHLAASGIPVGVDLFDDYFSQHDDARLTRYRAWLADFAPSAAFILCSTPAIEDVAARFAPGVPALVMNDPAPPFEPAGIVAALDRKRAQARQTGILRIGWFGIGDNPYFPVGLRDLTHFSDRLAALRDSRFDAALTIVTNPRSLTADACAMLARLPLPYEVIEWSEAAEEKLLAESIACFLPVSGQSFSTAKSLNRAVTCLTSGTQVLAAGYPLYRALDGFIYDDTASFTADLANDRLRLRPETVPAMVDCLAEWAGPATEARRLTTFLAALPRPAARPSRPAVVHGQSSGREMYRFAHLFGAVSVASPFCGLPLAYDLHFAFAPEPPGLSALVSDSFAAGLSPERQAVLGPSEMFADRPYRAIDLSKVAPSLSLSCTALEEDDGLASTAACYPAVMDAIAAVLAFFMPDADIIVSDAAPVPWGRRAAA